MVEYINAEIPCPLCGQMIAVEFMDGTPAAERQQLALANCKCPGAERKRLIDKAYAALDGVAGVNSTRRGFDYPVDDDTILAARRIIDAIVDDVLREAKIRTPAGDILELKQGVQGKVKVKRTCKKQIELET